VEHRRNERRLRHAVPLDRLQKRLGLELVEDDRGGSEQVRERQERERRRVVERADGEVDVVHAHRRLGDDPHHRGERFLRELANGPLGFPVVPDV